MRRVTQISVLEPHAKHPNAKLGLGGQNLLGAVLGNEWVGVFPIPSPDWWVRRL